MLTISSRELRLPDVAIVVTEPKHQNGGVVLTALGHFAMLVDCVRTESRRFVVIDLQEVRLCEINPQNGIQGVFDQLELATQRFGPEFAPLKTFPFVSHTHHHDYDFAHGKLVLFIRDLPLSGVGLDLHEMTTRNCLF